MVLRAFASVVALAFAHVWVPAAHAAECKVSSYGTMPVELRGTKPTTIAKINGREARFLVDTGAWFGTMSQATAQEYGLKLYPAPAGLRMVGVGGSVSVQATRIEQLGLLGAAVPKIEFVVGGTDIGMPILGANVLHFTDLELDLANGQLRLMKPRDCGKVVLAYWAGTGPFELAELTGESGGKGQRALVKVMINGKPVRALLDTGASSTIIGKRAALRAGLDPAAATSVETEASTGFGRKSVRTWTVRVGEIAIGSEIIRKTRIQMMDDDFSDSADGAEMLLGIDFILAHRIYISNAQRRMYFTYNGGQVFSPGGVRSAVAVPAADEPAAGQATSPKTADDYALRGAARLSRGDKAGALTDLDKAVELAPDKPGFLLARAQARGAAGQATAMVEDLGRVLQLDPRNGEALMMRAAYHRSTGDKALARQDIEAAAQTVTAGTQQALGVAEAFMQIDQPLRALPLYDSWLRLHPVDVREGEVLNSRCWARALANQQLPGALDDCRKAIKRDGALASYLDSLGLVHLRMKNFSEAITAYQQALALEPKLAWSRYGLGLARSRGGQTEAGAADLAAAKAIDSDIAAQFALYGI